MKRTLIITVMLPFIAMGQAFDSTAWKFAETISAEELKKHLTIIASDEYEGRETGKKGQKMAMKYLINEFKSYGIKDVDSRNFVQPFDLVEQQNEGVSLNLEGKELSYLEDFNMTPSFISQQKISAEIIFVGYGISEDTYDDYADLNVKGKAVFFSQW